MIDVITNSSTEIFSMATSSGIESLEKLVRTIINTFDKTVKYEDVIKCIAVIPDECEEYIYPLYLKSINSPLISPEINIILEENDNFESLRGNLYNENERLFVKLYSNLEGFEDRFMDKNYVKFCIDTIEEYNYTHYEYPMNTDYMILAADDKYKDLVNAITSCLSLYDEEAVYC